MYTYIYICIYIYDRPRADRKLAIEKDLNRGVEEAKEVFICICLFVYASIYMDIFI
jgi:hypothetical protein